MATETTLTFTTDDDSEVTKTGAGTTISGGELHNTGDYGTNYAVSVNSIIEDTIMELRLTSEWDTGADWMNLFLWVSRSTHYRVGWKPGDFGAIHFYKMPANSLEASATSIATSAATSYVFKLTYDGTDLKAFIDGDEKLSFDISADVPSVAASEGDIKIGGGGSTTTWDTTEIYASYGAAGVPVTDDSPSDILGKEAKLNVSTDLVGGTMHYVLSPIVLTGITGEQVALGFLPDSSTSEFSGQSSLDVISKTFLVESMQVNTPYYYGYSKQYAASSWSSVEVGSFSTLNPGVLSDYIQDAGGNEIGTLTDRPILIYTDWDGTKIVDTGSATLTNSSVLAYQVVVDSMDVGSTVFGILDCGSYGYMPFSATLADIG